MLLLEGHSSPVYALAFSPDGRHLASGTKDGGVLLWDGGYDPRPVREASHGDTVNAIAFDPSGDRLAIADERGWTVWRVAPDVRVTLRSADSDRLNGAMAAKFLTEDMLVIGVGHRAKPEPGRLELWDLAMGRSREPAFTAPQGVRAVAVYPELRRVAWSEWGRRINVWDIVSPDQTRFNLSHNCPSLSFHPDGDRLAAAAEWGVKVFDLARKQERLALKGHKGTVSDVAYSPDGRTLATGSWDSTVRLWDPETGAERACYQWPTGKVFALAYSPDGLRLATAGEKGTIAVWDVD